MGLVASTRTDVKKTEASENGFLMVGASSVQGWRNSMDDYYTQSISVEQDKSASFFAVYDGHGSPVIAEYANSKMLNKIVSQQLYTDGDTIGAMKRGFLELDSEMKEKITDVADEFSGSTAVCVIIKEKTLYCANVGDSKAILSLTNNRIQVLTTLHTPGNEEARIKSAGGIVKNDLIDESYALSRALGDYFYKTNAAKKLEDQIITAQPDVCVETITGECEFLVIATDGIWDTLSDIEVIHFIRKQLTENIPLEKVCENLLDKCLASEIVEGGKGCDNMAVIVVCFKHQG